MALDALDPVDSDTHASAAPAVSVALVRVAAGPAALGIPSPARAEEEELVAIAVDVIDLGTSARAQLARAVVGDYEAVYRAGKQLPPPPVVFTDGERFWIGDGALRVRAARAAGRMTLECRVRRGTRADALALNASCDLQSGARRTMKDRRAAVLKFLEDPTLRELSAVRAARLTGVSDKTFSKLRDAFNDGAGLGSRPRRDVAPQRASAVEVDSIDVSINLSEAGRAIDVPEGFTSFRVKNLLRGENLLTLAFFRARPTPVSESSTAQPR